MGFRVLGFMGFRVLGFMGFRVLGFKFRGAQGLSGDRVRARAGWVPRF